jgi:lincosamide nucleotidyltransferase A/C/D/E
MRAMREEDVCELLALAESLGVRIWLDGGWAVDAWLGAQTRSHADVDIEVETVDAPRLVAALRDRGYEDVPRDDTRPWNFVLGDGAGREVDFHLLDIDGNGDGIYGPPDRSDRFPAEALAGRTRLCDRVVAAITPAWLVRFHTGYQPDENDRADVLALCGRFGIAVPEAYRPLDM